MKRRSPAMVVRSEEEYAILLFDGVCNLCNGAVNFIIDHDASGYFKFASLQSDAARPLLARAGLDPAYLNSLVLIEAGQVYRRSGAVLEIIRHLDGPWPLLYVFKLVPRPIRDCVYDWVTRHRYQWFGRRDSCRVPTPDLQARFLG